MDDRRSGPHEQALNDHHCCCPAFQRSHQYMPWNTCFYPRIGVLLFNWILTDYTQQVSQRLSIWRSNYGSTAIDIIAHFLSLEYKPVKGEIKDVDEMEDADKLEDADVPGKDTDERRSPQEICGDFMTGLAFLFKDLEAKPENVF